MDLSKDIAVAQLEFNVSNLKNQLQFIQTTMMAYEHTIHAQRIALDALEIKEHKYELLVQQTAVKESEELEPVFGRFFQVKKRDKDGIVIDYPEVVRALKRKFKP